MLFSFVNGYSYIQHLINTASSGWTATRRSGRSSRRRCSHLHEPACQYAKI